MIDREDIMGLNSRSIPYFDWINYRINTPISNNTQNTQYVKQVLSQSEYQKYSNRVEQGPDFDLRRYNSSIRNQDPHCYGVEKMFGDQEWTNQSLKYLNSGLYVEFLKPDIPGTCENYRNEGCVKCRK